MVRYHNSGTQKFDETEHESVSTDRQIVANVPESLYGSDLEIYLDDTNGDDNNDGLSKSTAFETWARATKEIPRCTDGNSITINIVGDYNGQIEVSHRHATKDNERINVVGESGNPLNHEIGKIKVFSSTQVSIQDLSPQEAIDIRTSKEIVLNNLKFRGTTLTAVRCISSHTSIRNCDFDTGRYDRCIAVNRGIASVQNNTGSANDEFAQTQLGAVLESKNGGIPNGETVLRPNERFYFSGVKAKALNSNIADGSNIAGSRSFGNWYQNTSDYMINVTVRLESPADGSSLRTVAKVSNDKTSSAGTIAEELRMPGVTFDSGARMTMNFLVPSGGFYQISQAAANDFTLNIVSEKEFNK